MTPVAEVTELLWTDAQGVTQRIPLSGGSRVLAQWNAGRQAEKMRSAVWSKRAFDGAQSNRLTASWRGSYASLNADLRMGLPSLRARSRDLAQNNDYVRRFLSMVQNHVIGPAGFALQMRVPSSIGREIDTAASDVIEQGWATWQKPARCDWTGRRSFRQICALLMRMLARDGEILVRMRQSRERFALEVLDIARLDERANGLGDNGNRVYMGIELDADNRPVAYHIRRTHPGDAMMGPRSGEATGIERVPADEIIHAFVDDDAEQLRGVPWIHTAMSRLKQLGAFEEAAVIASRIGASKMGFFKTPEGDLAPMAEGVQDDPGGELMTDAEPGVFSQLPPGFEFQAFDPQYPHQHYDAFIKSCLRGIASGLGVSYHTLANDLEGVNFSSIRSGTLEEREGWMAIQAWFADAVLDRVFERWIDWALLRGQLGFLTSASRDRYMAGVKWQGRRWQWVDPVKDIEASKAQIELGTKSRRQICDEQGVDFDDVVAQLATEKQQLEAAGLSATMTPPQPNQGAAQ